VNAYEYAILLEAEKVRRFPGYHPKGWEQLLKMADDLEERLAKKREYEEMC